LNFLGALFSTGVTFSGSTVFSQLFLFACFTGCLNPTGGGSTLFVFPLFTLELEEESRIVQELGAGLISFYLFCAA
jgi:hypothetical protein